MGWNERLEELAQQGYNEGKFHLAAYLLAQAGKIEQAIQYYKEGASFYDAARTAETSVEFYVRKGYFLVPAVWHSINRNYWSIFDGKDLDSNEDKADKIDRDNHRKSETKAVLEEEKIRLNHLVDEAIICYELGGYIGEAVNLAWRSGRKGKAIELYESTGFLEDAARLCWADGQTERAIKLYEKTGSLGIAALVAWGSGQTDRAIQLSIDAKLLWRAAEIALSAGLRERAIGFYEQAGEFDKAARVAQENQQTERAIYLAGRGIEQYVDHGFLHNAAEFALEIGGITQNAQLRIKAAELYEKAGEFEKAAGIAVELGLPEVAIRCYQRVRDSCFNLLRFDLGVEVASKFGLVERASELAVEAIRYFEKNEAFFTAAKVAESSGQIEKARRLRERAVEQEKLKNWCFIKDKAERVKLARKAIKYRERKGNFGLIPRIAEESGLMELAIAIFRKHHPSQAAC